MKNKKKNWRHILLRGSALMAAVLMCFAGSFPAFAAEDPAEPGGSVDVLEGEWTFKDRLSLPSFIGPEQIHDFTALNYTVTRPISSAEVEEFNSLIASQDFDLVIPVQDYTVVFNCSGFNLAYGNNGSHPYFIFNYRCDSYTVSPSSSELITLFDFLGYPGQLGNETYHSDLGGWKEDDWIRTVDFGSGVAVESPIFMQWFTSNAIPHRDMWSLTERLQAVAASIWSVIVTISSTIVSNPLLLFTSGFLFLGGCIALFSRLLARR